MPKQAFGLHFEQVRFDPNFRDSKVGKVLVQEPSNSGFLSFSTKPIRKGVFDLIVEAVRLPSQGQEKHQCWTDWVPKRRKEFSDQRPHEESLLQGCSNSWTNKNLVIHHFD